MDITEITRQAGAHRRRRRVGRGRASGCGKTCGRGSKGAGSRTGPKPHPMKAGGQMPLFRQIPKRGFSNAAFRCEFQVVNVQALEDRFESGTHVTPEALQGAGLIRRGRVPVKILGEGDLTKPLKVDAAKFSRGAAEKIVAAGGEARVV